MKGEGYENDAALDGAIKKLDGDLKRTRKKEVDGDDMEVCVHASHVYVRLTVKLRTKLRLSHSSMFLTLRYVFARRIICFAGVLT